MVITVTCPACAASFPVDPNKIPEGGVKVRCSACANIFRVERPAPEMAPPEAPQAETSEPAAEVAEPFGVETGAGGDADEPEGAADAAGDSELASDDAMPDWAAAAEDVPGTDGTGQDEAASATDLGDASSAEGPTQESGEAETTPEPMAWDVEPDFEATPEPTGWNVEPDIETTPEPTGWVDAESESETTPESTGWEVEPDIEATPEPTGWVDAESESETTPESTGWDVEPDFEATPEPTGWEVEPQSEALPEPTGWVEAEPEPAEPEQALPDPVPIQDPAPTTEPESPVQGFTFGKRDPMDKARRLARVLVSDMVMYNSERHQHALAKGTLAEDFEEEIEKSWKEFVDQVGSDIADGEGRRFWSQALNDILAKGASVF